MAPIKSHSKKLLEAFTFVRIFLQLTGQLPFAIHKRHDGTNEFKFHIFSCNTMIFGFVCVLNSFIFIFVTIGFISVASGNGTTFVNKTSFLINANSSALQTSERKPWENVMIQNHLSSVIVIYIFLTLTFISSMYILFNGSHYVHYWNYWNRVVQIIDIDPTEGVRLYLMFEVVLYVLIITTECALFSQLPGLRATAGVYVTMLIRLFDPALPGEDIFLICQILGFIIIVYGHVASRAIIIQFVFFTKLLGNTAKVYNARLRNALKLYLKREPVLAKAQRENFRLLLKDHLVIAQLFRMTNGVFGLILRVYYLSQLIALLFEIYYMWKLLAPESAQVTTTINKSVIFPKVFPPAEPLDEIAKFEAELLTSETLVTTVLLIQTVVSCFLTTSSAHQAHKEVMIGFKIIRQRGLIACRTKTERNFVYNMLTSFARSNLTILSAGGYFSITKAIFAGMILSVCGYFVILIQFDLPRYRVSKAEYRSAVS